MRVLPKRLESRRKSAPAHITEISTAPSKIPLPVPSSPVESQQSSVSQGAQLPSPSSSSDPEETVVYTGEACSHVSQNGISFHFPASKSTCRIELRYKVVNDDYVLPKGYEDMPLVSSMFKITASDELPVPVTVRMEHCAIIEEDGSLVHMIAHGPPPYHFQPLLSGTFPLGERYGEMYVHRFSIFTTLAKKLGLTLSLSVQVFYHDNTSSATLVVTKNLQCLISAVKSRYAAANRVVEQSMSCGYETEAITLTVPDPPQEGGWCVLPEFEPAKIETRLIRNYKEGRTPPGVHLKIKWTGEGEPVEEDIRIAVGGTISVDSFLLSCRPACASDSSLAALSLSPQRSAPFSPISPPLSLTSNTPHQSQTPTSLHTHPTQHTGTLHLFQAPTSPPTQPTDTPHLSPSLHTPPAQLTDTRHMQPALPTDTPPAQTTDLLHPPPPAQHTDTPHPPPPAQHTDTPHPPSPPAQHTESPAHHAADHLGLSAESRALRRSNTVFIRGVDPDNLVTVLYSNFLLTPEEYEKASQTAAPGDQRLKTMFKALERRVSANPSVFHTLIQVLQGEEALKDVADVMKGESNLICEMSLTCLLSYVLQEFMKKKVDSSCSIIHARTLFLWFHNTLISRSIYNVSMLTLIHAGTCKLRHIL